MNQQQLKAIERFQKAYDNLKKVGLTLFLHESDGYICKTNDLNEDEFNDMEEYMCDLIMEDKAVRLGDVYIHNYNA